RGGGTSPAPSPAGGCRDLRAGARALAVAVRGARRRGGVRAQRLSDLVQLPAELPGGSALAARRAPRPRPPPSPPFDRLVLLLGRGRSRADPRRIHAALG